MEGTLFKFKQIRFLAYSRKTFRILISLIIFMTLFVLCIYYFLPKFNVLNTNGQTEQIPVAEEEKRLTDEEIVGEASISIEKISLSLPVIINVNGYNEEDYYTALQKGVAHFKGTSLPGQPGNVFVFGHSSDWRWNQGEFKSAFKQLPELESGDLVIINYKDQNYKYQVFLKEIVAYDDLRWVAQTSEDYLTLMTCYPVGSSEKRIVIRAKAI